jgi:hypothetical protein
MVLVNVTIIYKIFHFGKIFPIGQMGHAREFSLADLSRPPQQFSLVLAHFFLTKTNAV